MTVDVIPTDSGLSVHGDDLAVSAEELVKDRDGVRALVTVTDREGAIVAHDRIALALQPQRRRLIGAAAQKGAILSEDTLIALAVASRRTQSPAAPPPVETPQAPVAPAPPLADLLDATCDFVRQYVVMSELQCHAVALHCAHTHALDACDVTPYISVWSAEKRADKTRFAETYALVVARPWFTGRVTAAVLVRRVARDTPTLLLDESDAAFKGEKEYAEALRGILNTGHRRGGTASLCVGRNCDLVDFPTFCPKVIAGIGKLPDTVADRSIRIELKRRRSDEPVTRFRQRDADVRARPVREGFQQWAPRAVEALRDARPDIPTELDDRAADSWEPLLAIADLADGPWPAWARRAALALSAGADVEDDSLGVRLLADVRAIFEERQADRIATKDLVMALVALDEVPWGSLRGEAINARILARLLKPYGITSKQIRVGDVMRKGYEREALTDAWARYVPGEGKQGKQAKQSATDSGVDGVSHVSDVSLDPATQAMNGRSLVPANVRDGDAATVERFEL